MGTFPVRLGLDTLIYGSGIDCRKSILMNHYPMHWHEFYEIDIVLKGSCVFEVNGEKANMKEGDVCIVSPVDFHSLTPTDGEVEYYNIMLYDNMISDILYMLLNKVPMPYVIRLKSDVLNNVKSLCEMIIKKEITEQTRMRDGYIKNLTECVLIEVLQNNVKVEFEVNKYSPVIRKTIEFIRGKMFEKITMAELAKFCNYSENYIVKKFKEYTGITVQEYLSQIRCGYARNLLVSTDATIKDICYESGFQSFTQFWRTFTKHYGETPSIYRRKAQKKIDSGKMFI